jgi:uncharacterized protein (DUF2062 family)
MNVCVGVLYNICVFIYVGMELCMIVHTNIYVIMLVCIYWYVFMYPCTYSVIFTLNSKTGSPLNSKFQKSRHRNKFAGASSSFIILIII